MWRMIVSADGLTKLNGKHYVNHLNNDVSGSQSLR